MTFHGARSEGIVAGIAIGAALGLFVIITILIWIVRTSKRHRAPDSRTSAPTPPDGMADDNDKDVYYDQPELRGEVVGPIAATNELVPVRLGLPWSDTEVCNGPGKVLPSLQPGTTRQQDQKYGSTTDVVNNLVFKPISMYEMSSSPSLGTKEKLETSTSILASEDQTRSYRHPPQAYARASTRQTQPLAHIIGSHYDPILIRQADRPLSSRHFTELDRRAVQHHSSAYAQLKGLTAPSSPPETDVPPSMLMQLRAEHEASLAKIQLFEKRERKVEEIRQSAQRWPGQS